jgi:V/A-type H+-transporting ATPase subunit E
MSKNNLIKRIEEESTHEITQIQQQAKKEAEKILKEAQKRAKIRADHIIERGKNQSENQQKILISKTHQDVNRKLMNAKEAIIDDCFKQAHKKLANLKPPQYRKIATILLTQGSQRIQNPGSVIISRTEDKEIAKKHNLKVTSTGHTIGGMIIQSKDEKLTIDNTFEGILQRKKHEIRTEVGKILF